jgi:hypothetical protein
MTSTPGHTVSILLRSDAFEAELNAQILAALRSGPAAATMASPAVLAGPPNRSYFVDHVLARLTQLPFVVEIVTADCEVGRQLDRYEDGLPDPAHPKGTWHAMALDLRMQQDAVPRNARLFVRELPSGDLVQISVVLEPNTVDAAGNRDSGDSGRDREALALAELLLGLTAAYPVLVGTLGRDTLAVDAAFADGETRLDGPMSLEQLAGVLRRVEREHRIELAVVGATLAGAHKSFIYDRHDLTTRARRGEGAGGHYDLRRIEELRGHVVRAEADYDAMYESKRPKDDKDDALAHLAKAIGVAGALGLEHISRELQARHEHIVAVYNAQFRR